MANVPTTNIFEKLYIFAAMGDPYSDLAFTRPFSITRILSLEYKFGVFEIPFFGPRAEWLE